MIVGLLEEFLVPLMGLQMVTDHGRCAARIALRIQSQESFPIGLPGGPVHCVDVFAAVELTSPSLSMLWAECPLAHQNILPDSPERAIAVAFFVPHAISTEPHPALVSVSLR